ncbi:MAG: FixH family protein [Sphingomonadales bacterium]|nr:FixH family protein [Sphingomonadales bacterium]
MSEKTQEKPTTGWFVMRWLGPLFGVMFIVNGIFVWFALNTHTGSQTENAYDKGMNYNQVLERARAQELLGWGIGVEVENNIIQISLFDDVGSLIKDADVEMFLFDPRSAANDQFLTIENASSGQFFAEYSNEATGQWELRLKVNKEGDVAEFRRKLVLP